MVFLFVSVYLRYVAILPQARKSGFFPRGLPLNMLEIRGTLLQIPPIDAILLCLNSDFLALHGVFPTLDSRGALKLRG